MGGQVSQCACRGSAYSIRLLIGQYPNGDTHHVIFGLHPDGSEAEVLHVFEGFTADGQWLTYTPETPWEGLDRIGVGTDSWMKRRKPPQ